MNALQQFPTSLNAFNAWCTDQGPKKAGLPVAPFEQLHTHANITLTTLTTTGEALYALRDAWNNTVTEGASPPPAAVLLAKMKDASSKLDGLLAQTGNLQAALQPLLPIVANRRNEINASLAVQRKKLNQAQAENRRIDGIMAEIRRKLAAGEGNNYKLRQELAGYTFMDMTNEVLNLEYGYSNLEWLQDQLNVCNDLSSALDALRNALAASRNLMNDADEPMTSSIRAETGVLGATRKGAAAYYKREVGREMEQLIATFSG